ncbi:response regulator transcription factor [Leekyejoonella antrihumi]|uniref:Response regulator n=1 Tax=Leekyejoonella antrihumi TaxID=1660198 RepID=A0A563E432_9MICO|nr:response regulator transcription factor [Leekyejoonella antrihumi]TWP36992.1 response regulator [Leekyejoonella antrihumi]
MSPTSSAVSAPTSSTMHSLTVLLYSDDIATRDVVRVGAGRRPARDVEIDSWFECATAQAVVDAVETQKFDLLILDGEAAKVGGLGLTRQLKNEIFQCPPVIVLTGRAADGWLASWSEADAAVPHPIDPLVLTSTIADVARRTSSR